MNRLIIIFSILLLSNICLAQQTQLGTEPEAFQQGLKLLEQENYEQALQMFERSYRENNHLLSLWNMAVCKANLGRYLDALNNVNLYMSLAGGNLTEEERASANQMITELRSRLGVLKIQTKTEGGVVIIDGGQAGSTPLNVEINLAPGSHTIRIEKQGFNPYEREVEVRGGEQIEINTELTPNEESMVTSGPAAVEEDTPIYKKWWFWTVIGVVAVGTGVGVGLAVAQPFEEDLGQNVETNW